MRSPSPFYRFREHKSSVLFARLPSRPVTLPFPCFIASWRCDCLRSSPTASDCFLLATSHTTHHAHPSDSPALSPPRSYPGRRLLPRRGRRFIFRRHVKKLSDGEDHRNQGIISRGIHASDRSRFQNTTERQRSQITSTTRDGAPQQHRPIRE